MEIERQLQVDDILKSLREQIGEKAQEVAVLKATIEAIMKIKETPATTTATPFIPNVEGTKGI